VQEESNAADKMVVQDKRSIYYVRYPNLAIYYCLTMASGHYLPILYHMNWSCNCKRPVCCSSVRFLAVSGIGRTGYSYSLRHWAPKDWTRLDFQTLKKIGRDRFTPPWAARMANYLVWPTTSAKQLLTTGVYIASSSFGDLEQRTPLSYPTVRRCVSQQCSWVTIDS